MQRKRDGLVPIIREVGGLAWPEKKALQLAGGGVEVERIESLTGKPNFPEMLN